MNGGSFHELELALEALAAPEGLPEALAGVLELSLEPDDDALTRVVRALGSRSVLLVLAGFEGLVGDAAVLEHLLTACPGLKLLVTTRGRLNLEAEWVYPFGGLGTPPAGVALTDALGFDAVRHFVGRAKRARLGFALTSGDLPAVPQIYTRVQGSPLGIELAAGWVSLLPCREIAAELARDLDFLATQLRDAPLRQRSVSVRAAPEGSWNRPSLAERSVLRRPSVFRGGFTRQAASEVAGATLPVLAALVDKSLLRVSDRGRYDRHLLISGYTQEKLAEVAQEEAQTKEAYGAYFLKLAEAAEPRLKTGQQKVWLERLEEEFGNLRAAFGLFVDGEVTINEAPKLASALHHFWRFRHAREGRAWLERVLEHGRCYQHAEARAKACRTAGDISSSARGLRAGHRLSRGEPRSPPAHGGPAGSGEGAWRPGQPNSGKGRRRGG